MRSTYDNSFEDAVRNIFVNFLPLFCFIINTRINVNDPITRHVLTYHRPVSYFTLSEYLRNIAIIEKGIQILVSSIPNAIL